MLFKFKQVSKNTVPVELQTALSGEARLRGGAAVSNFFF
jgi:hypothetical protein